MQPNRSWSPWRNLSSVVTCFAVGTAILIGFGLLALLPTSGFSIGESIEDQLCVTTSRGIDDLDLNDSTFGKATSNGVRSATTGRAYCKAYDDFQHPYAAQVLAQMSSAPMLIAVFGLTLGLRRIINRTWEAGPFHVDAVRLLDRFRWWAAGAVAVAMAIQWVLKGVKLRLLTDEPWPDVGVPWVAIGVWVALTLATICCETVAGRRDEGLRLGLDSRTHDDNR